MVTDKVFLKKVLRNLVVSILFRIFVTDKTTKTMSILKFSDGEEFDTSVELQLTLRKDGWYVIGSGLLIPVRDLDEGRKELKRQKDKRNSLRRMNQNLNT